MTPRTRLVAQGAWDPNPTTGNRARDTGSGRFSPSITPEYARSRRRAAARAARHVEPYRRCRAAPTSPAGYSKPAGRTLVVDSNARAPAGAGTARVQTTRLVSPRARRSPMRGHPSSPLIALDHARPRLTRSTVSRRSLFKTLAGITPLRIPLSPTTRTSSMVQESRATRPYPHARDAPVIRSSRCGADHAAARPPIAPARAQSGDGVRVSAHLCISPAKAAIRVRSSNLRQTGPEAAAFRARNRPQSAAHLESKPRASLLAEQS